MIRNAILLNFLRIKPSTCIHIGADRAQDRTQYVKLGARNLIWGESNSVSADSIITSYPNDTVINKFFTDKTDNNIFTTLNFELNTLTLLKPIMITIDTDGEEINVLNGGSKILKDCDYLVIEQVFETDYGNWHKNITALVQSYGFKRTLARKNYTGQFEDVLYTKFSSRRIHYIQGIDVIFLILKQIKHLIFTKHFSSSYFYCSKCKK